MSELLLDPAGRRRSPVTAAQLDAVADGLNARTHKRLDFATPTEQLSPLRCTDRSNPPIALRETAPALQPDPGIP